MEFLVYCKLHGILIDHVPEIGIWKRYATEDHPHKRNGAVKFMGNHAFVQNHAIETEISVWQSDTPNAYDPKQIARAAKEAEFKRAKLQREAAGKAAWILKQCQMAKHEYLKAKGFDEDYGNVWVNEGQQFLVIPMRSDGHLVGAQVISQQGEKKFLYGQRTTGATFTFDNKGPHILTEGYATALSVRMALKQLKRRYTLHVCFSAGNMVKVAAALPAGLVIADNDESGTGERVAKQIGWPYWMSDTPKEDANDCHRRAGLFRFSQSLTKSLVVLG
jgi:putative DNA primase/helicase